jgi:hypothetical protein
MKGIMKKNLRKSLLVLLLPLLFSCNKNAAKVITIDEGITILSDCLKRDAADDLLSGKSYGYKSSITAPVSLQKDLPYLSLSVIYSTRTSYLTNITLASSQANDSYEVFKDTSGDQTTYLLKKNGGTAVAYNPQTDSYLHNFFELPGFLLNENRFGLKGAKGLLDSLVSSSGVTTNRLTSYNLYSSGGGNLDVTLRGDSLDFSNLFSETPQINTNVQTIHFVIKDYLVTLIDATYVILPPSPATSQVSSSPAASSPQGLKRNQVATSSSVGTLCSITMELLYS